MTFALERPTWRTWASDISSGAVAVARANAARLGATELCFATGDLFEPLDPELRFDLITGNPPYIPEGELSTLQPDIRDHEPHVALTSGVDGLDLVRSLCLERSPTWCPGSTCARNWSRPSRTRCGLDARE